MKLDRKRNPDIQPGAADQAYAAWREKQIELGLADIEAGAVLSDAELQAHFEARFTTHASRQDKQVA